MAGGSKKAANGSKGLEYPTWLVRKSDLLRDTHDAVEQKSSADSDLPPKRSSYPEIKRESHDSMEAWKARVSTLEATVVALQETVDHYTSQLSTMMSIKGLGKPEAYYQKFLERRLGAKPLTLPCGRTDLTTDDAHIEIKSWTRYHEVPGQLGKYQLASPRRQSIVYFFGLEPCKERLDEIETLMRRMSIDMYSIDRQDKIRHHACSVSERNDVAWQWIQSNIVTDPRGMLSRPDVNEAFRKAHPTVKLKDFSASLLLFIGNEPLQQKSLKNSMGWRGYAMAQAPSV